jgi:hypothetical protein
LGTLRDQVFARLQSAGPQPEWGLALHGLADGVEDVIVTVRRLASHERVWHDSKGTKPAEPPVFDDPNQNAMQQMLRGRSDLRGFILLSDVLLDDAVKALRLLGASKRATKSFFALVKHLEAGGAAWSKPLLPLTEALAGLQYSLGYFRDKFVVHRGLLPVTAIYLPDGKVRLQLLAGTKSARDLERGGRAIAALIPVSDTPLDPVYDVRLDIAFAALQRADQAERAKLAALLDKFGAISPDPFETGVEVAETLTCLFTLAERKLPAT